MNQIGSKFYRVSMLGAMLAAAAVTAIADVPRLIHYQGKLRDTSGAVVTQDISLRVQLYDVDFGGNVLFDETHNSVAVTDGLFNVLIGSESGGVPDAALDSAEVWLGVSIDDGDELTPRTRIASSPHAIKARSAEQLVVPGTFTTAVAVDGSGQVGVGTDSPGAAMEVNGNVLITNNNGYQARDCNGDIVELLNFDGCSGVLAIGPSSQIMMSIPSIDFSVDGSSTIMTLQDDDDVIFPGRVGVGESLSGAPEPEATLDVAGNVKIADGTQGAGKVLTSDSDGLASWQSASSGGGTLDQAYDGGGSGAGRTITVDSGPVVLNAADGDALQEWRVGNQLRTSVNAYGLLESNTVRLFTDFVDDQLEQPWNDISSGGSLSFTGDCSNRATGVVMLAAGQPSGNSAGIQVPNMWIRTGQKGVFEARTEAATGSVKYSKFEIGLFANDCCRHAIFRCDMNGSLANYYAVTKNVSETATDTGVLISENNPQTLRIVFEADSVVYFYIDGVLRATHTTNVFFDEPKPWVRVTSNGSSNNMFFCLDYVFVAATRP